MSDGFFKVVAQVSIDAFERDAQGHLTASAQAFRSAIQEMAEEELRAAGATCCFTHEFKELEPKHLGGELVSTGRLR